MRLPRRCRVRHGGLHQKWTTHPSSTHGSTASALCTTVVPRTTPQAVPASTAEDRLRIAVVDADAVLESVDGGHTFTDVLAG